MNCRVCIIGSGPTGIYTLKSLIECPAALEIIVYEAEQTAGKGTPYLPDANDPVMLSNIPSIEIPLLKETLVDWLHRQDDGYLSRFSILRRYINEREFYPRLVLGDYFQDQFVQLLAQGKRNGHEIEVYPGHRVVDIELQTDSIRVRVATPDESFDSIFHHVVMATGHNWPKKTEVRSGFFSSPWPAAALRHGCHGRLGVLGTSLSAIDALLTVAACKGSFILDDTGILQYVSKSENTDFSAVMLSRKGLLPEADFYCPLPYQEPRVCTKKAVEKEIAAGVSGLLDRLFDLFSQEIQACDPDYATQIGLGSLSVDTFADAYFSNRSASDPFVWAAENLAEAEINFKRRFTVPWRYAILITHEIIELAVPHFDTMDLQRFNRSFKSIFIDDYATVPHLSIRRLLALRNANRLTIKKLGDNYDIGFDGLLNGARITTAGDEEIFDTFIDATGQTSLSAHELPFPTLVEQRGVHVADNPTSVTILADDDDIQRRETGGIALDERFRPRGNILWSNRLYCVAIPFLLHRHPFVQGVTSAAMLGKTAAGAILEDVSTSIELLAS
ncbi:FAD/NAD(P)-binding protein [Rhizobium sp. RM]|uniref:FAD/NAD(P)-binding protein n=1 Tax=Rhizobium sp. RM TaxID=2748079 RepID=UPI00110DDC5E|nr:FAD/NAD(P)-binding protein [Rhizobium sp. RM]NWJ27573.1 FAD/NAD(P)-binding protein [Rhizobium sp. RM]TMV19970.1 hypothetical protein BJG94_11280 [Rhizobium sp. Td3]